MFINKATDGLNNICGKKIAYLRKDGVTAILGVTIKSGKDKDYSRYDAVAKHEQEIYEEIEMLLDGTLPENSDHLLWKT